MPATPRRRRLRWFALLAVGLMLAAGGAYAYLTRPAAVRAALLDRLDAAGLVAREMGAVSFTLSDGLTIRDLAVDPRPHGQPISDWAAASPVVHIVEAHIGLSWYDLLFGRVRIQSAKVHGATLRIRLDRATGRDALRTAQARTEFRPQMIPQLTAENVDVQILEDAGERLALRRRWVVRATGRPTADGYDLRFIQVGGRRLATAAPRAAALATCHLRSDGVEASTDWFALELLSEFLPASAERRLSEFDPRGHVRLKHLRADHSGSLSAELEVESGRCVLPVEVAATGAEPFARIDRIRGSLRLARDVALAGEDQTGLRLAGSLQGRMRDDARVVATLEAGGIRRVATGEEEASVAWSADDLTLDLSIENWTLPTRQTAPGFVTSERLPGAVRNFFWKYKPDGRASLTLRMKLDAASSERPGWRYEGVVEALGAKVRYLHFPYDISDARGFIRFSNDGVVLDHLTGRHGSARITLSGKLVNSEWYTGFDLVVDGRDVPLEPDLYDALPEQYRSLWREVDPLGLADIRARIHRPHGSPESWYLPTVEIDARLLSASLAFGDRRVRNATGRVHIGGGVVALEDVCGRLDGGDVVVNGTLAAAAGENGRQRDISIEADNVPLSSTSTAPGNRAGGVGAITFEGRGDVWGRLWTRDGRDVSQYVVRIRDGRLRGFDGSEGWSRAEGWAVRDGNVQRIENLRARRGHGWIEINGETLLRGQVSRPMVVSLRAGDEHIESLLNSLVPNRWSAVREALGLAGVGEVALRLQTELGADGATQTADIELQAERMRPTPAPLDLRDIAARIQVRNDGFTLHEATARYADAGRIRVHGAGGWDEQHRWSEVGVDAENIDLSPDFVRALPRPLGDLLRRMSVRGRMRTTLDRLRLDRAETDQWQVSGRVSLDSASLSLGVALTDFSGRLTGSCQIIGGEAEIGADFEIDRGTLMGRPIARWEGRLSRGRGQLAVRLTEVRGRLCEGEIVGEVTVDPATTAYELSATLHDVNLALLLDPRAKPGDQRPGRVGGHVFVRGVGADPTRREGGGDLRISSASLLSNRVSAPVVRASRDAPRPLSESIDQAELRFAWRGPALMFERVDIRTRDLRLIGEGWWNSADDSLSLTLIGAHPEDAPRLAVITDLLELAGKELLQYRIDGTLANPRVTVQPLHNLTEPLRRLLGGD